MKTALLSCREAASRLWGLLDRELPDAERLAVLLHLRSCAMCDSHRRHAEACRRAVRDAGLRGQSPPSLGAVVLSELRREAGR